MKRKLAVAAILCLLLTGPTTISHARYKYESVGVGVKSSSGLTILVEEMQLIKKTGSTQLVLTYTQTNTSRTKKIDEGSFKLFFTNGTSEAQYGFFGSLFPGDKVTKTYRWEWKNAKKPLLLEWEADFFATKPSSKGLKWRVVASSPTKSEKTTQSEAVSTSPSPTESSSIGEPAVPTSSPETPVSSSVPVEEFTRINQDAQTSNGLVARIVEFDFWGSCKGRNKVDITYTIRSPYESRTFRTGRFSLHFESGNPLTEPSQRIIQLKPQKKIANTWSFEFSADTAPAYLQWNPTTSTISRSKSALRWAIPEFRPVSQGECAP